MTLTIDRRALVRGGALGLGALLLPGGSAALAQVATARGFTHGVASGEPSQDSVLLWTRFVPKSGDVARVSVAVSEVPDFRRTVAGATVQTGAWRDWTVKAVLTGLEPGRTYFYRFSADGQASVTGRMRTLPAGRVDRFRMAVFSCSNLPFGHFNAYAHAAAQDDIQLGLHLGDYYYEYGRGTYPSAREALVGRLLEPANECLHLADYRLRHACYRADPDLQALHARLPMLASTDDHEAANDSWEGGAENHDLATEGDWSVRKAAALQAWREWMPVGESPWAAYEIGDLATFFRTETRLLARSRPLAVAEAFKAGGDPAAALVAFRDGAWSDASRTMMGLEQERWLDAALGRSVRAGKPWQLVGSGTVMGRSSTPPQAEQWLPADSPDYVRARVRAGLLAAKAGLPSDFDGWGGFPAARARLLGAAQGAGANLVVLSGDSHNGWAFDLAEQGRPAGVEFAGHSVTSPGLEAYVGTAAPADVARALVVGNPELKWMDAERRGYMTVSLTPEAATSEWHFLDTVRRRSTRMAGSHRMRVQRGRNRLETS